MSDTIFGINLEYIMFMATISALVSGFPQMSGSFRKATIIFLVVGMALLAYSRQDLSVWLRSAGSMTSIIAIVTVMQVFSVPITVGGYDSAIRSWMEGRFQKRSSFFALTTMTTHILASFLSMGAIPVMVNLFGPLLKECFADWKIFLSQAFTRGYILSALWSPGGGQYLPGTPGYRTLLV